MHQKGKFKIYARFWRVYINFFNITKFYIIGVGHLINVGRDTVQYIGNDLAQMKLIEETNQLHEE